MLQSADAYTHFELESLPSGVWGYLHFPVAAKYARTLGKDCQGMTGKFHTSWGDFHSLKNRAALEFECLRMLSYGFACSIGDQMEPRGTLNPATYRRIGEIYEKIARYEPWARPSVARVEAALVTSESYLYEQQIPESVMGAAQLLDELGLQYDIIDQRFELDAKRWPLLLLADDLHLQAAFERKLDAYVQAGGCVVAFGENLTEDGRYPACFGVEHLGARKPYPDFLAAQRFLCEGLEEDAPCVMYRQGQAVQAQEAIPACFCMRSLFSARRQRVLLASIRALRLWRDVSRCVSKRQCAFVRSSALFAVPAVCAAVVQAACAKRHFEAARRYACGDGWAFHDARVAPASAATEALLPAFAQLCPCAEIRDD